MKLKNLTLPLLAAPCCLATANADPDGNPTKPNVVFIYHEDIVIRDFSC